MLINFPLYGTGVAYIFILFLFLFLSHISFIFSFSSLPPSLLSHISLSSSPSAHRISLSSSPSAHCLHLYSLIYLFLLFLQLTASISTLWHCRFGVLSLTLPIWCSLFLRVADSRISELPISSLFYLRVVDSLFAVQSHRFAVLKVVEILSTIADSLFNIGIVDSPFYIYYVQVSSLSSLWFSRYFGVYFYSLYLLSSYVLCAVLCICFINSSI